MPGSFTGRRMVRREDPRLLRGHGRYIADLALPGMLHASILRSQHAHARIIRIDAEAARRLPGVAAVLTAEGLGAANRRLLNRFPHPMMRFYPQAPLASAKVHYAGEPVAAVAAESRYLAEDAMESIRVEYEPLGAVVDVEAALRRDTPVVHDDQGASDNLAGRVTQRVGDVASAFARAHVIVRHRLVIGKCAGVPMECRGLIASVDELGRLAVWNATQTPHMVRDILAELLGLAPHDIRVIPPDVGGGFGVKEPFYPEDFLIPYLAHTLRRPVKWIEDRRENLLASVQERGQIHDAELAVDRDGRILGVRDAFVADSGAYCAWGIVVPLITSTMIPGPYKVPAYRCDVDVVYTNSCPLAPYRGAGRPQAVFAMERLLDQAARDLRIDPVAIRLRNFIQPEEFPYEMGLIGREGSPVSYDSGNYPACLRTLTDLVDYQACIAEREAARAEGRRVGIGIAFGLENNGLGPHEGARIRVDGAGRVVIYTGACSQGQGHLTTLSQLAADVLTVPPEHITLVGGDTDGIPYGTGTFASRTAVTAGNAVVLAAQKIKERILRLGAHLLEARPEDVELANGDIRVRGVPDRRVTLAKVAAFAGAPFPGRTFPEEQSIGLEATEYFVPRAATYSSGVHFSAVEVDPETGTVHILKYGIVHDCGNVINPLVVEGQLQGGFAAGIGNALYEEVVYDADGQLLTGTLLDYLIPTAGEVPGVGMAHVCTPSPLNPLGLKGAGENATIQVPACINNAVSDALGFPVNETPLAPSRVRALLHRDDSVAAGSPGGRDGRPPN
jgi:aerobic carbon-monoxide dehydrogenase large subunit